MYPATRGINELVRHRENGLVFDTSDKLAAQIESLLGAFPVEGELKKLRDGVRTTVRWDANWRECARAVLAEGVERAGVGFQVALLGVAGVAAGVGVGLGVGGGLVR